MNKANTHKNFSLYKWIWQSYIRNALIPLIIIEIIFICIYFISNYWSHKSSVAFYKDQSKSELNKIIKQEVNLIDQHLSSISNSTMFFSLQMGHALSTTVSLTPTEYSRLSYSNDNIYYTKENNSADEAAIFYNNFLPATRDDKEKKIAKVLTQQKLMADIKNSCPLVNSIYFNTFDSLNITYPYVDVFNSYNYSLQIPSSKFYYEADANHNPDQKVKWVAHDFNSSNNNFISSAICPVYNGNFLEGVVGIDINMDSIVNKVLEIDIPWNGYNLLIGKDGNILSLSDVGKSDLNLDQLVLKYGNGYYQYNLYNNNDLSTLMDEIQTSETGFSNFTLKEEPRIACWSAIPNTDLKLLIVVPTKNIYSNADMLRNNLLKIGIITILGLILSYLLFFLITYKKVKNMSHIVSGSLLNINNIVQEISSGKYDIADPLLKISELEDIALNLIEMGHHIGETNKNLLVTQSELRKKEVDFRSLVDSINDIISEIDINGYITKLWSSVHTYLYKLHMHGHLNSIYDILDESTAKIAKEKIHYVIKSRKSTTMDFNIQSKDGLKWFEACISPHLNYKDRVVVLTRDITEQKKMARSIITAKEEAEKASKAKSEFLSSMSHELRTPLNAILGFSQILELDPESPLNPSQSQSVKEISKAGSHLLELINEILDLAKIESGKLSISIESVPIKHVIEEAISIIKPFADKHKIKIINYPIDNSDEFVSADHTRLKQILLNLLSNAIKYNKKDGQVIFYHDKVNDKYRFHVIDTGIGLSNSDLELIFKPFYRLNRINNSIEGTGIGLAVAKQLTELMNGEIFVTSEKGAGSHFWIELPCIESSILQTSENMMTSENRTYFPNDKFRTILYAEDNPANLRLVERALSQISNLKMLSANSGELCLDLAIAHKPDIILLDINLPGIDGYEVFKRLKMHKETKDIPIIAVSAHAMPRDIEKGLSLGFSDYITKPIDIPNFIEKVCIILAKINKEDID
ncbi:ATP-binding protein [Clostridium beijerinckii]|jgi:PAS domain S-box|uniref:Stage 0 sporulation protein A homolog n=2 Tax=Clostridium beijerinckii TaxID=1520 RepID=A0AAE2RQT6_CLOBE|nr:ATP-binding protein [Clostridium beijerinckii]ABR36921.1 multi-sensor hybrid histidine kinase [Clostridium beijerinckii NCIMB 8052]AIU04477.1 multi-sensor hybrid histidine kinase [Clostridium beijerinckii ATCC 35702]MBF7808432.1 response regulator [Clostridium beijerinckii]NOW88889.1 signal transduction histidine kinase/ActR/RegA family two-component response regulator [Clostridium beijerinckii]NRT22001.1 signal transduction histidine kinase/ActR/RegA family two-component response regulator